MTVMHDDKVSIKKQTISGLVWKFGERIFAQLVSFIVSIVLARLLMPTEYGVVALVLVFISMADILVQNGLGATLIQKKDADDLDFNTMFFAGVFLGLCLYGGIFLIAPTVAFIYKNSTIIPVLRVMGIRIPIAAVNSIQQAVVSRNMDFRKFFFSTLLGTAISGVIGIVLAFNGFGVWALVFQYLGNTIIDTLVLFFTVRWRPKKQFSIERFKKLFSFGGKIMLIGFIGVFFNQLKSLIIGAKYSSEDLAYYSRGEKFPTLISGNIETSINAVLFSMLSKYQDNNKVLINVIQRFTCILSFIIMPLMIGLAVIGENLVKVLLTDKWLECVPFLQIICIQQVFSVLNTVNLQVMKAKGVGSSLLKLECLKKPVILIILLITMRISPFAMAVGVTIYELIAAYINSIPTKKLIGYSIRQQIGDVFPNLVTSLLMGCIVYTIKFIPTNSICVLILQVLTGMISYVLISYLTNNRGFVSVVDLLRTYKEGKNHV